MAGGAEAKRTAIIVDDDPVFVRVMKRVLETQGLMVITHERSLGILQLLRQHLPAMVLVDVMMSGLDGPMLVKLIRENMKPAPLLLLCSGLEKKALEDVAAKCQADGCVSKSDGLVAMQTAVTAWVRKLPARA